MESEFLHKNKNKETEATIKLSFKEVHLLATQEKLFTDGELKILISAPEKRNLLKAISSLVRTSYSKN